MKLLHAIALISVFAIAATAFANSGGSASGQIDGVNLSYQAVDSHSGGMYSVTMTAASGTTNHFTTESKMGSSDGKIEVTHEGKTYVGTITGGTLKDFANGKEGVSVSFAEKEKKVDGSGGKKSGVELQR